MSKFIYRIYILMGIIYIIGCQNDISNPIITSNKELNSQISSELYTSVNQSVSELGSLRGFIEYYNIVTIDNEVEIAFYNGNSNKIYFALSSINTGIQRAQKFSLTEISKTNVAILLVDDYGYETTVSPLEYASYTFYNATAIFAEENISIEQGGTGKWENNIDNVLEQAILIYDDGSLLKIARINPNPPDITNSSYTLANQGSVFSDVVTTYRLNQ